MTSNAAVLKPVKLPVSSSRAPKFPVRQEAMFRETLMVLNRCRVPYVVSGAFALQVHTGIWRTTKDLDLFLTPDDMPAALRCLKKNGFRCQVKDPVWLHKAHRHGFFIDLITGMSNAVFRVDRSWIKRARPRMVLDVRARVLAAEELLVSKLFVVRRERFDGADIAHIVYASQGNLDWNRILTLVKEDWEILLFALVLYRYVYPAYGHYVPAWVWQRLLVRFSNELTRPDPSAKFRGSLVDEKMFAIDVSEWGMADVLSIRRNTATVPETAVLRAGGRK
ncbi:MAG: nucleotidyltransferase [Terriglobales bacterium]